MALFYPDRLQSNNPSAYGIVKGTEVSGYKQVALITDLYTIADAILSEAGDGSDALGQVWFVQEDSSEYRLISWENRGTASGWRKDETTSNIGKAKTEVTEKTDGHVTVTKTVGTNGQSIYTVNENDIASAKTLGSLTDDKTKQTAFGKIAEEADRAKKAEKSNSDRLDVLEGSEEELGSVASTVKSAINGLDLKEVAETGKPIVSVSQTDGVVSAKTGDISSSHVSYKDTTVEGALNNLLSSTEVSIWESGAKVNEIKADGKTYTLKQGTAEIGTINIAKDMVVSEGSVITATNEDGLVPGDKYIKLVIANSSDILYIPVNELYKDHTGVTGNKIKIEISADNKISGSIVTGSIEKTDLTESLQTEINKISGDGEGSVNKRICFEGNKNAKLKGTGTSVNNQGEVAIGNNNISSTGANPSEKTIFSVGNGTESAPSNAVEVREDGSIWVRYRGDYKLLQEILDDEIDWYEGQ